MKPIWIVIITVVIVAILGAGGYYYWNGKMVKEKNDLQTQIDDLNGKIATATTDSSRATTSVTASTVDTSSWKSLALPLTKGTIKYPDTWTVAKEADTTGTESQITTFTINKGGTSYGAITEYKVSEWLKGNDVDAYQLPAADRAKLLVIVKNLYSAGKLTDALKTSLNQYSQEFMTYQTKDRVYMDYLATADGKSKGVAMIGTHGQDYALPIEYVAFIYNPDHDSIVEIYRQIASFSTEATDLSKQYSKTPTDTQDKKVHADFVSLMATTPRASLSFAKYMDEVDASVETLKF